MSRPVLDVGWPSPVGERDVAPSPVPEVGANVEFAGDVLAGLSLRRKSIPPKYFYDATGSLLFEAICRTTAYYVTRAETQLLAESVRDWASTLPLGAVLVEFGSGECAKTHLVLEAAPQVAAYVPVDISVEALHSAMRRLKSRHPDLRIVPLEADFTHPFSLPDALPPGPRVGFFPGSTLGNFDVEGRLRFLRKARGTLGVDAQLFVGVDLVKDEATMLRAYDDPQRVTARFNRNLLIRINRELRSDFDPDSFDHVAVWNRGESRIEMHLVSRYDQFVSVEGYPFRFRAGETLHTESSYKFTVAGFSREAEAAGWRVKQVWVSGAPQVALFQLAMT